MKLIHVLNMQFYNLFLEKVLMDIFVLQRQIMEFIHFRFFFFFFLTVGLFEPIFLCY